MERQFFELSNRTEQWDFADALQKNSDDVRYHEVDLGEFPQGGLLTAHYTVFPHKASFVNYNFAVVGSGKTKLLAPVVPLSQTKTDSQDIVIVDEDRIFVRVSYGLFKSDNPYGVSVTFTSNSENRSAATALPVSLPGLISSKLITPADINRFRIDLTDFPDGALNVTLVMPAELLPSNEGVYVINALAGVVPIIAPRIIGAGEGDSLTIPLEGCNVYDIEVSSGDGAYNPNVPYLLEIEFVRP